MPTGDRPSKHQRLREPRVIGVEHRPRDLKHAGDHQGSQPLARGRREVGMFTPFRMYVGRGFRPEHVGHAASSLVRYAVWPLCSRSCYDSLAFLTYVASCTLGARSSRWCGARIPRPATRIQHRLSTALFPNDVQAVGRRRHCRPCPLPSVCWCGPLAEDMGMLHQAAVGVITHLPSACEAARGRRSVRWHGQSL